MDCVPRWRVGWVLAFLAGASGGCWRSSLARRVGVGVPRWRVGLVLVFLAGASGWCWCSSLARRVGVGVPRWRVGLVWCYFVAAWTAGELFGSSLFRPVRGSPR